MHFDIIVGTFCLLRYKAVENLPAFALNAGEETGGNEARDVLGIAVSQITTLTLSDEEPCLQGSEEDLFC